MQSIQRRFSDCEISFSRLGEDVYEESAERVSEPMKQDVPECDIRYKLILIENNIVGMVLTRDNRSTRGGPSPSATLSTTNHTRTGLRSNPGVRDEWPGP